MENKKFPDLSTWQKSMFCAVAMGYGPRVADALCLEYPEASTPGAYTYDDELYRMLQEQELYHAMASVTREVADARPPVSDSADFSGYDSSWSDSSGDGGVSDSGGGSDSGSDGDFID